MNYSQDHYCCWDQKVAACGMKEHLACCLCRAKRRCGFVIQHTIMGDIKCATDRPCKTHEEPKTANETVSSRDGSSSMTDGDSIPPKPSEPQEWIEIFDKTFIDYNQNKDKGTVIADPNVMKKFIIKLLKQAILQERLRLAKKIRRMKKEYSRDNRIKMAQEYGYNEARKDILELFID